jgi:hypothetical protein
MSSISFAGRDEAPSAVTVDRRLNRRPSEHSSPAPAVPRWFHLVAGLFVVATLLYSAFLPRRFPLLIAEDGILEWLTVTLFVAAGALALRRAIVERRPFDALIGLFCLVVAGEEMSWGQRLLGLTPPEYFLANNWQQEINLHNMTQRPRKLFSGVLLAFGVLMPLAWRWSPTRRLMDRVGATPPMLALVPWVLAAVLFTQWDPNKVSSEWAECLAGGVFLAWTWRTGTPGSARRWRAPMVAMATALLLTIVSTARGEGGSAVLACVDAELAALADDVVAGDAATDRLREAHRIDKMIWQAHEHGELAVDRASRFRQVDCEVEQSDGGADGGKLTAEQRRRYAVDPWGVAYWVAVREGEEGRELMLYSFGPNRRRDLSAGAAAGDDIVRIMEFPRALESAGDVARPTGR